MIGGSAAFDGAGAARLARRLAGSPARLLRRQSIYARYRAFTMLPRATYVRNLRLAEQVADVPGCVVECGTWRGGMIAGIAEVLGPERDYWLFDSFEGLPPAGAHDGPTAVAWQADRSNPRYYDNCRASLDEARNAMERTGRRYRIVPGWFRDTIPSRAPTAPIALLRLDGDLYDSTRIPLEHLFPRLAPGALVILDDYCSWEGCTRAVNEFLGRAGTPLRLRQLDGDVCYIRLDP